MFTSYLIEKRKPVGAVSRVLCRWSARGAMAQRCLSFIYGVCRHTSLSFYPPTRLADWGGPPSMCAGLRELSASGVHSPMRHRSAGGLLPHLLTLTAPPWGERRLFSSAPTDPCEPLPVRKRSALCCPDFPLTSL